MTLEEFQQLDGDEREPIIAKYGTLIGRVVYKGRGYRVLALFKFFVEFIYEDETFSTIYAMRSFSHGPQLDKYSDLDGLLEEMN